MTTLHPGDQIDSYRVESLVARGGMASVFRGMDLRTGAHVAIKVPHPEAECDPVFFERFHREATIGREMDHPGVVQVMHEGDQGRIYMVMEWVEGPLLRHVLAQEGKLPPERAIRIAASICNALEYIHSRGVVHRDLKPENIVVAVGDRIKLMDFGIAARAGTRRLTFGKFSQLMGTVDYISPEQVRSKRGDARSDLYSLGIILYEMLTGKTPFPGTNPVAVMNNRLKNNPIPPRQLEPDMSPQLEEIICRALERDPKHRYGTAREFACDLEQPDRVRIAHSPPPSQRETRLKRMLMYAGLAMIPASIFALLLYVASHQ